MLDSTLYKMRTILLYISLLCCFQLSAQELVVKSFTESARDISARTMPRQDINGEDCALVKVQFVNPDAQFSGNVVGETHYMGSEFWVYMADGSKRLKVNASGYLPLDVNFADYGINKLTGKSTYILTIIIPKVDTSKFKRKAFYIEPKAQIGKMMAFGASIGGFYNHLNLELNYLFGLTSSEEVFWNTAEGGNPFSYSYRSSYIGGRFGYAFYVGKPFRITPQIGLGTVQLRGTEKQTIENQVDASKGYALNALIAVRFDYLILPWLGVGIAPQYNFPLKKSDLYDRISDVSSKVKGYANGFNVNINVFVTF